MNANNELIEHLLKYDVIVEAEKITKRKYNEDSTTQRVAALNFIKRSQKLAKELKTNADTHRGMRYLDFVNNVMELGFKPIFNESFEGTKDFNNKPVTEMFLVFYHETKGIVLVAESFGGSMVNAARMYYNWTPNLLDGEWRRAVSSGSFDKTGTVWGGYHEVNEALKYKLDLLHRKGFFTPQWVIDPRMWLVNYQEARATKDYDGVNMRKMNQFPEIVRKAIRA